MLLLQQLALPLPFHLFPKEMHVSGLTYLKMTLSVGGELDAMCSPHPGQALDFISSVTEKNLYVYLYLFLFICVKLLQISQQIGSIMSV